LEVDSCGKGVTAAEIIAALGQVGANELPAIAIALAGRMAALSQPRPGPEPSRQQAEVDPLLTVAQAAALLGYRPSYLYEMLRHGDLPAIRDRKFVRVRQSAISEYIAHHERRGPLPLTPSHMLTSSHNRRFNEAQAQPARTQPSRARRRTRVSSDNGREVENLTETDQSRSRL
jgi:excisionase family DNA binding protein